MSELTQSDFDQANMIVLFPEQCFLYDHEIVQEETPETQLIQKEKFSTLSDEARFLLSVILTVPLDVTSSVVRRLFHKRTLTKTNALMRRHGWTWNKIETVKEEIKTILRS